MLSCPLDRDFSSVEFLANHRSFSIAVPHVGRMQRAARQRMLQSRYFFICSCAACRRYADIFLTFIFMFYMDIGRYGNVG